MLTEAEKAHAQDAFTTQMEAGLLSLEIPIVRLPEHTSLLRYMDGSKEIFLSPYMVVVRIILVDITFHDAIKRLIERLLNIIRRDMQQCQSKKLLLKRYGLDFGSFLEKESVVITCRYCPFPASKSRQLFQEKQALK